MLSRSRWFYNYDPGDDAELVPDLIEDGPAGNTRNTPSDCGETTPYDLSMQTYHFCVLSALFGTDYCGDGRNSFDYMAMISLFAMRAVLAFIAGFHLSCDHAPPPHIHMLLASSSA